jgi:transcriptional pleiotropic regulator of transition state genes
MKTLGIVRKVDELGRIVLPIELRRTLNIKERDTLEIFLNDDSIVLKKHEHVDIFTGDTTDLITFYGKKVSKASIMKMVKEAGLSLGD